MKLKQGLSLRSVGGQQVLASLDPAPGDFGGMILLNATGACLCRLLEQGAFADVKQMNYMDGKLTPPQKAGYAVIVQDNTGSIIHEKSRVIMV